MRNRQTPRPTLVRSASGTPHMRNGSLAERRLRLLVARSTDVTLITNANGRVRWASPALEQQIGVNPYELVGTNAFDLVHADDRSEAMDTSHSLRTGQTTSLTCRIQQEQDTWRWHQLALSNHLHDLAISGMVWNARDITLERLYAEHPTHEALIDTLTGLPNRALLLELADAALARAQRSSTRLALLLVDLDRFNVINDSAGHTTGDLLLTALSQRLLSCIRTGDTVARIGSDEFAILLEHVTDPTDAAIVAQRILDMVRAPFIIANTDIVAAASIGISISDAPATGAYADEQPPVHPHNRVRTFGDLLRNADIALNLAKANGGNGYVRYAEHMGAPWRHRLALETDLQRAIARNELHLDFQPEVDSNGQIVSLEALVRWTHPQHGLLPPDRFIPLAEETGQINALGDWVLHEACASLRTWRQRHPHSAVRISVNLSTRQLEQPDFATRVATTLQQTGIAPDDLCLELTESTYLQTSGTPDALLQELHALGVHLAIDDFGIGYSSLAYLSRLHAQVLKIDRSFIAGFGQNNGNEAIVRAIVPLAHALGMLVTAEGVETAEQRNLVHAAGCDRLQGYHFSRPRPAADIDALLAETPPWMCDTPTPAPASQVLKESS